MSDDEMKIAIAEVCGWRELTHGQGIWHHAQTGKNCGDFLRYADTMALEKLPFCDFHMLPTETQTTLRKARGLIIQRGPII